MCRLYGMDDRKMTTKRFPLYQDIINLILAYLVIISIDMVLSSGMRAHIPVIEYVAIALIGLYTYILKEFVTKMYIYAALHMVMVAICIFIPADELSKVKIVIIAVVYCIIDAHNWISGLKSSEDVHVGLLGAIFFSFIFCSGKYEFGYSKAVYYMGVMFIVLVLVRMIVTNFYDLSRSGQLTDDMPVRELFKNNSLIASGIIVMIVTFMIFVRSDELILILNNWLYNIMEKIVGVIFRAVLEEPENGTDDLLGFLNPNNLPQVNHIDENKQNNCASNLLWVSASENCKYGNRNVTMVQQRSVCVVATDGCMEYQFNSIQEAARELHISAGHISQCCNGKRKTAGGYYWSHR